MKLNNSIIILDLEATSNQVDDKKPLVQENNYIIEIGAVLISKDLEIVSTFSSLVRPEEPVTPFITGLTGITQEQVDAALLWPDVSKSFEAWASTSGNIKNVRLAAWGNYFDMPLLRKVYRNYSVPFPFSGVMFDIKTVAFMWAALSGRRTDKLSVDTLVKEMGITVKGDFHRALVDAEAEAQVFIRAMKDLSGGVFIPDKAGAYRHLKVS